MLSRIKAYSIRFLLPVILLQPLTGCLHEPEPAAAYRPAPQVRQVPQQVQPAAPPVVTPPLPAPVAPAASAPAPASLAGLQVRIRYAQEKQPLGVVLNAPATLRSGAQSVALPAGHLKFTLMQPRPAQQRFHVFPKTFQPGEQALLEAYLAEWRQQGYQPKVEVFGRQLQTAGGRVIDNQQYWVSLAQFPTQAQADALIQQLKAQSVWAWQRPETISPGAGALIVTDAAGVVLGNVPLPATLESTAAISLMDIDSGFWRETRNDRSYAAPLTFEAGATGALEVLGWLPVETYLRGVVPAEMPASWPAEALAAQAVAARSEVLSNLAGKHRMEGFDFCALEHCRAYRGLSGYTPSTDAAVQSTAGEVITSGFRTVPTVFSANCGGWTENNEIVWSGPPNPALRAVADFPKGAAPPALGSLGQWLGGQPRAYCAGDTSNFRWTRRYTQPELTALVNKKQSVGTVQSIEPGPRGSGGRLKTCKITGSSRTVVLDRELAIRLAFGGLPSAVFTVERSGNSFVFRGAGRGHGVGLCQQGARAMASGGISHENILRHYFTGVQLERLRY